MAGRVLNYTPRIQRLQPSVVAQVRSGVVIAGKVPFVQAVIELVANSLDACQLEARSNASYHVAVSLDVAAGSVRVVDNGHGIAMQVGTEVKPQKRR